MNFIRESFKIRLTSQAALRDLISGESSLHHGFSPWTFQRSARQSVKNIAVQRVLLSRLETEFLKMFVDMTFLGQDKPSAH